MKTVRHQLPTQLLSHNVMAERSLISTAEEHQEGLKTSAGNSIKRLLGCDGDLVKFDDLRFKLKEAKRAGTHVHMTTSISVQRTGSKDRYKNTQHCCFSIHQEHYKVYMTTSLEPNRLSQLV